MRCLSGLTRRPAGYDANAALRRDASMAAFRIRTHGPDFALGGTDLVGARWTRPAPTGPEDLDQVRTGIRRGSRCSREPRPSGTRADFGIELQRFVCRVSCAVGGRDHGPSTKRKGARVSTWSIVPRSGPATFPAFTRDQLLLSHQFLAGPARDGLGGWPPGPGGDRVAGKPDEFIRGFFSAPSSPRPRRQLEAEAICCTWACQRRAKWRLHLSATIGRPGEDIEDSEETGSEAKRRAPRGSREAEVLLAVLLAGCGARILALDPMGARHVDVPGEYPR